VFWSDERCVPTDEAGNHFRMADANFLSQVPIPAANINPIICNQDAVAAAADYEGILRAHFNGHQAQTFDVVLLGLTAEGQAGALMPNSELLEEDERWAVSGFSQEAGEWRVSLSPKAINAASHVVFVVQGKEKIEAVRKALKAENPNPDWPASYIQPTDGEVHWFSDQAAALLV
jgi:6-phosphogluconolactonase